MATIDVDENHDSQSIAITVPDEDMAREVGYALCGRAQRIHEDPGPQGEDAARMLRAIGQGVLAAYGDVEHHTDDLEADTDTGALFRGEYDPED